MMQLDEVLRITTDAECLHDREAVNTAIRTMAGDITSRLAERNPVVLSVLNGGIFFTGELLLHLVFPLELDSIKAGRYQGETRGSEMRWQLAPSISLKGRTVLLVDDILDEGITLAEIKRYCLEAGATEVFVAVLIDKQIGRVKPCQPDFVGLTTEDRYLFGYGLDYKNYLRNWPGIFACKSVDQENPSCH